MRAVSADIVADTEYLFSFEDRRFSALDGSPSLRTEL